MAAQVWARQKQTKTTNVKKLGVTEMFCISIVYGCHRFLRHSKLTGLYILDRCSLLYLKKSQ